MELAMPDASNFALNRPEHTEALFRGDMKIKQLMARDVLELADDTVLIQADRPHDYVYRMRHGWAGRVRTLPDARSQFILIGLRITARDGLVLGVAMLIVAAGGYRIAT